MEIKAFALERYFAKYEFTSKYMLSSSDCDGYSMDYVLGCADAEEKKLWEQLTLGYTPSIGSDFLRTAIAKHYQNIQPEEVIVASAGELNFILMNLLLKKSDHMICMAPMYQSLYQIAQDLGAEVSFWEPTIVEERWHYAVEDLKKLVRDNTKLIIINFPHNPTGYSPSLREYEAIIELARSRNIPIFSDEMYRFLDHSTTEILPSLSDLYENGISLWGMAKTFGLAGLRLGWLSSKNKKLLHRVECFKDYLSICNNAPSEVLATIALNHLERFVQPNLTKIKENIQHFSAFHEKHKDLFDFYKPQAGSTAFIRLKIKETALEFSQKLVQQTSIMLLPSETFEYGTQHARIGFGRSNMPEVLMILENYLQSSKYK